MLGFAFLFLPTLHNFFFLSFSALTYFATGTWREGENRLRMKEARGSKFKCETENSAKILHRAFIFRHIENLLEKNQLNETGLLVDFLHTGVLSD